jgi:hypothetical protein
MRLRQLSTTQQILFLGPPEVTRSIRDICDLGTTEIIDSYHVIFWLLRQTCQANQQLQPLYSSQGHEFCRKKSVEWECTSMLGNLEQLRQLTSAIQRPERWSLLALYGFAPREDTRASAASKDSSLKGFVETIVAQSADLDGDECVVSDVTHEEVEQEREIEFQVMQEREVQRPPRSKARSFPGLSATIQRFVETGVLSGKEYVNDSSNSLEEW